MKRWPLSVLACFLLLACSEFTFAHKASDSYLRFTIDDEPIKGQWDIALRDLDYAIGLDGNDDGHITWGELRSRQQAITNYALPRLQISGDGFECWSNATEHLVDNHTDGAYAVLRFSVICPATVSTLKVEYGLLFDLDPLHRGLLQVNHDGQVQTGVLSPEQRTIQLDL